MPGYTMRWYGLRGGLPIRQQHNAEDYTAIRHIYHPDQRSKSQLAYTKALNAIAPLRKEKLRRQRVECDRFSGIDPADLQIDRTPCSTTSCMTSSQPTPKSRRKCGLDLQQHELEAVITGFKTAADPKRRTRWPRKIELAK